MKVISRLTYIVNYKPHFGKLGLFVPKLTKFSEIRNKYDNSTKLNCKHFFFFYLFLEYFFLNYLVSSSKIIHSNLTIHKANKKVISVLRAPNKYKKAQIKINLARYKIVFKTSIEYNTELAYNLNYILYFTNFFFSMLSFFETTLFFLKKKELSLIVDKKALVGLFGL